MEINDYASIQIEAQYFKEIDIQERANFSTYNIFRPGEREMMNIINSLREFYFKNMNNETEGEDDGRDSINKEMIPVDLSGVESNGPNGLVIAAGILVLLIACVVVFIMLSRRNASVQRLSVVIKERLSTLDNGATIKVKKTANCNNTIDVIDGQAVATDDNGTDRAGGHDERLRLKK